jgi:hypothetical protein
MTAGACFDVAVVGRAADVAVVAAATASALAARSASRAALVVGVGERRPGAAGPATAPARRLRDRVAARDLEARARGRIVWCAVDECAADPTGGAYRAAAAAVGGPVVLAVCGPRAGWVEPLLDEAATVLVAGATDDPLTALAIGGLRARGLDAASIAAPDGLGAVLARIGLGRPGAWRDANPGAQSAGS